MHKNLHRFFYFLFILLLLVFQSSYAQTTQGSRFIIKWKAVSQTEQDQAFIRTENNIHRRIGLHLRHQRKVNARMDVVQLDQGSNKPNLIQVLNELNTQSDVEYAVVDERRHIQGILPSDPLITPTSGRSGQWYLFGDQPSGINAFSAWDYSLGGSSTNPVTVAVLDTGVRYDHPDLTSKLLTGYDFVSCDQADCSGSGQTFYIANDGNGWDPDASDPGDWVSSSDAQTHPDLFGSTQCQVSNSSWHGTRVAGIIGASTNNGIGVAGIGWNTRILPVRVLGKCCTLSPLGLYTDLSWHHSVVQPA